MDSVTGCAVQSLIEEASGLASGGVQKSAGAPIKKRLTIDAQVGIMDSSKQGRRFTMPIQPPKLAIRAVERIDTYRVIPEHYPGRDGYTVSQYLS